MMEVKGGGSSPVSAVDPLDGSSSNILRNTHKKSKHIDQHNTHTLNRKRAIVWSAELQERNK